MQNLKQHKANIHSQGGEDGIIGWILERLGYPERLEACWCLDIGAWDGVFLSNVHALVKRGAAAVEVEANPDRFKGLEKTAEQWWPAILPMCAEVTPGNVVELLTAQVEAFRRRKMLRLLFSLDIDGNHAAILEAMPWAWQIIVAEYCDMGNRAQFEPLLAWAAQANYAPVAQTNANLIFVPAEDAAKLT